MTKAIGSTSASRMVGASAIPRGAMMFAPRSGAYVRAGRHRGIFVGASSPSSSSKDAELKQLQEFKDKISQNLQKAATSGPSATTNEAANTADLEEVKLDEYWTAVETLSAEDQVLVMDFYTQWCGPCKLIKPILCAWAEEFAGKVSFRKFEASKENAPVGKQLKIKSVPTFIVYKGGEEFGRVSGKQEEKLRAMILEAMGN